MRYIKLAAGTKKPVEKLTTNYAKSEIADYPSIGMMLEKPYVVIDADDAKTADILFKIIQGENIPCRVMQTTRGMHFWFKTEEPLKNSIKPKIALTLHVDYRSWGVKDDGTPKLSYVKVKDEGTWREWLRKCKTDEMAEIPIWLKPLASKYSFVEMASGSGRNQVLYEYILTLQSKKFKRDEIRETINLINKYVFEEPLPQAEINTILRDESFKAEEDIEAQAWFSDKGAFLHNIFGDYVVKDMQIITYHDRTYVYTDGYYQESDNTILAKMIELYPSITQKQRNEVLTYIKIVTHVDEASQSDYWLNVKNGRLDLKHKRLYPHDPKFVDFERINATYDPKIKDPAVDTILNRVFQNDPELIELFKEILGYSLLKNTRYQMAFFMTGSGSNGKSTILEMVKSLFSYKNTASLSLTDLEDKFKVAELENKLINIGDDISNTPIKDTGKFKKLVSGQGVMVERKNQRPFELINYATFWFSANKMPNFGDKSDGMQRRISILPFNAKFSPKDKDYDPDIADKVMTDTAMSYLLNLAIEGVHQLRARGRFTQPRMVVEANEEYKTESSSVLQWFSDTGYAPNKLETKTTQYWYERYKQWCLDAGYAKPFSRRQFVTELGAKYDMISTRKRVGDRPDGTGNGTEREYYLVRKNPNKIKLV